MSSLKLLLFFLFFSALQQQAKAGSTFIHSGCSLSNFLPTSPSIHLNTLLTSIVFSAFQTSYNSNSAVYGLYQCHNDLSFCDCSSACVQSSAGQLSLVCAQSYAVSLQLDRCYVRYSNENFPGKLDPCLHTRNAAQAQLAMGSFFQKRDDALGDLQNGASYRVSSSGTVQGPAQSLGDLNAADCPSCLSQAVAQLENACGSALAADVFLAQCYAGYCSTGYYLHLSKG